MYLLVAVCIHATHTFKALVAYHDANNWFRITSGHALFIIVYHIQCGKTTTTLRCTPMPNVHCELITTSLVSCSEQQAHIYSKRKDHNVYEWYHSLFAHDSCIWSSELWPHSVEERRRRKEKS